MAGDKLEIWQLKLCLFLINSKLGNFFKNLQYINIKKRTLNISKNTRFASRVEIESRFRKYYYLPLYTVSLRGCSSSIL